MMKYLFDFSRFDDPHLFLQTVLSIPGCTILKQFHKNSKGSGDHSPIMPPSIFAVLKDKNWRLHHISARQLKGDNGTIGVGKFHL